MPSEASPLIIVCSRIIDKRRDQIGINPTWVATEAMRELDPDRKSPDLVHLGCHLELRQIARGLCRDLFQPRDEAGSRDDLFPDLQWRYPQRHARDEEPNYILREHMTDDDVRFNIDRLRAEGQAKFDHADALEAWQIRRRAEKAKAKRSEPADT